MAIGNASSRSRNCPVSSKNSSASRRFLRPSCGVMFECCLIPLSVCLILFILLLYWRFDHPGLPRHFEAFTPTYACPQRFHPFPFRSGAMSTAAGGPWFHL